MELGVSVEIDFNPKNSQVPNKDKPSILGQKHSVQKQRHQSENLRIRDNRSQFPIPGFPRELHKTDHQVWEQLEKTRIRHSPQQHNRQVLEVDHGEQVVVAQRHELGVCLLVQRHRVRNKRPQARQPVPGT